MSWRKGNTNEIEEEAFRDVVENGRGGFCCVVCLLSSVDLKERPCDDCFALVV